jgi:hypothetical protein
MPRDCDRSIPVAMLDPLAQISGVQWVSLQKGRREKPRLDLLDFTADLKDLSDTAALVMNLDLVIAVCTSVTHLTGALGQPLWTMISVPPDWRWMRDRQDSPWYPSMRLFRQPAWGDWPAVIQNVAESLRALLSAR